MKNRERLERSDISYPRRVSNGSIQISIGIADRSFSFLGLVGNRTSGFPSNLGSGNAPLHDGSAIYVREIFSRTSPLKSGKWLVFISTAVPLAFSALYEIIEWSVSLSDPTETQAFLGTHGSI